MAKYVQKQKQKDFRTNIAWNSCVSCLVLHYDIDFFLNEYRYQTKVTKKNKPHWTITEAMCKSWYDQAYQQLNLAIQRRVFHVYRCFGTTHFYGN